MKRTIIRTTVELTEKMLGTSPLDDEIYETFIKSKAPEEKDTGDEDAGLDEDKGRTGFHVDNKHGLYVFDYWIRGFFKSSLESAMATGTIAKVPAYKKWIDRMLFVEPRKVFLGLRVPDGKLERPLRAPTPKGERVALASSDYIKEGRQFTFDVVILDNTKKINEKLILELLPFGKYVGFGQWRGSGGYGRFDVVSTEISKNGRFEPLRPPTFDK